jgi:MFS family permease
VRRVLRLPQYGRLLFAYTANELAWMVGLIALTIVVYDRTKSAIGTTAYFLCSQFVPALFSPALVARVDQRPSRTVLAALFAVQAAISLILGLVATEVALVPLLAIVTVAGLGTLTTRSLVRVATLAVTTPAGLLREGNAVANAAFSVTIAAGPLIGGVVTATSGARPALIGDAVLLALGAVVVLAVRGIGAIKRARAPVRGRVRAALAYVSRQPGIRLLLALQAIAVLFFTVSVPVEVVLVQHSLHRGAGAYGALLSAWGGGAIVGSVIYVRWRGLPARQTIALGAGALGIGFLVMALAPTLGIAIAGAAIGGIGNGSEAVAVRTVLQEQVDEHWMAMVMSLNDSIAQSIPGAGIVLGGAIGALAGPRPALAVAGVGALAVTVVAWVMVRPAAERAPARPVSEQSRHRDEEPPRVEGSDGDRERRLGAGRAHPG